MRISSPPVPEIQAVDVREMAFALSLFQGALSQRLPTKNPSQRGDRIRATAKPIITSTPKITSARFTGRDYVRASADLHNRAEICTGGRGLESPLFPNAKEKAPFFPSTEQFLLATGLSTLDSLHNPLRKDIHSQSVLRFPLIFNLPHGFFYPRRAGIFSPIGPRSLTHLCKIL